MKTRAKSMPVFKTESDEAEWWASVEMRDFPKQKSAELLAAGKTWKGSPLVAGLNKGNSGQIALRLPEAD